MRTNFILNQPVGFCLPCAATVEIFFAHMTAGAAPCFMRDDDDEDDYDAPDNDEILETMFPDEDDDFWTDNYDVN